MRGANQHRDTLPHGGPGPCTRAHPASARALQVRKAGVSKRSRASRVSRGRSDAGNANSVPGLLCRPRDLLLRVPGRGCHAVGTCPAGRVVEARGLGAQPRLGDPGAAPADRRRHRAGAPRRSLRAAQPDPARFVCRTRGSGHRRGLRALPRRRDPGGTPRARPHADRVQLLRLARRGDVAGLRLALAGRAARDGRLPGGLCARARDAGEPCGAAREWSRSRRY